MPKDQRPAQTVVISALQAETKTLNRHKGHLELHTSGMGGKAVHDCLTNLNPKNIKGLISWGVCGALQAGLAPGDLILPTQVINQCKKRYTCDTNWRQRILAKLVQIDRSITIQNGTIINSNNVTETPKDKAILADISQADAVDMESFTIAIYAVKHQLPFIVVRSVVDTVDDYLPSASRFKAGQSGPSVATLINALSHPLQWPRLIRTGTQFNAALNSLAQLADHSISALTLTNTPAVDGRSTR